MSLVSNRVIRKVIQYTALFVLIVYVVFRISIPLIIGEKVYLDKTDGWVIAVCSAIALTVEAVKKFIIRKTEKL